MYHNPLHYTHSYDIFRRHDGTGGSHVGFMNSLPGWQDVLLRFRGLWFGDFKTRLPDEPESVCGAVYCQGMAMDFPASSKSHMICFTPKPPLVDKKNHQIKLLHRLDLLFFCQRPV